MSVCRQSRPRKTRLSREAYGWRTPRALRGSSISAKASSNVEMGAVIRDQASWVQQSELGNRLHQGGGTLQSSCFLLGLLDCFDETLVAGHFLAEVAQPPESLLQEGGGLLLIQGQ